MTLSFAGSMPDTSSRQSDVGSAISYSVHHQTAFGPTTSASSVGLPPFRRIGAVPNAAAGPKLDGASMASTTTMEIPMPGLGVLRVRHPVRRRVTRQDAQGIAWDDTEFKAAGVTGPTPASSAGAATRGSPVAPSQQQSISMAETSSSSVGDRARHLRAPEEDVAAAVARLDATAKPWTRAVRDTPTFKAILLAAADAGAASLPDDAGLNQPDAAASDGNDATECASDAACDQLQSASVLDVVRCLEAQARDNEDVAAARMRNSGASLRRDSALSATSESVPPSRVAAWGATLAAAGWSAAAAAAAAAASPLTLRAYGATTSAPSTQPPNDSQPPLQSAADRRAARQQPTLAEYRLSELVCAPSVNTTAEFHSTSVGKGQGFGQLPASAGGSGGSLPQRQLYQATSRAVPFRATLWEGVPHAPVLRAAAWRLALGVAPPNNDRRHRETLRRALEYRDFVLLYYLHKRPASLQQHPPRPAAGIPSNPAAATAQGRIPTATPSPAVGAAQAPSSGAATPPVLHEGNLKNLQEEEEEEALRRTENDDTAMSQPAPQSQGFTIAWLKSVLFFAPGEIDPSALAADVPPPAVAAAATVPVAPAVGVAATNTTTTPQQNEQEAHARTASTVSQSAASVISRPPAPPPPPESLRAKTVIDFSFPDPRPGIGPAPPPPGRRLPGEVAILDQLDRDLPRHRIALFRCPALCERLRRILFIYGLRSPAVGYVQGMDDVAAVFFFAFLDEAFALAAVVADAVATQLTADALTSSTSPLRKSKSAEDAADGADPTETKPPPRLSSAPDIRREVRRVMQTITLPHWLELLQSCTNGNRAESTRPREQRLVMTPPCSAAFTAKSARPVACDEREEKAANEEPACATLPRPWTTDAAALDAMLEILPPCALDLAESEAYYAAACFFSWGQTRYTHGQSAVFAAVRRIDDLVQRHDPTLHAHIASALCPDFSAFAYQHVHLLLVRDLGPELSLRLFDALLSVGPPALWELHCFVCAAWLIDARDVLFRCGMEDGLPTLQNLSRTFARHVSAANEQRYDGEEMGNFGATGTAYAGGVATAASGVDAGPFGIPLAASGGRLLGEAAPNNSAGLGGDLQWLDALLSRAYQLLLMDIARP